MILRLPRRAAQWATALTFAAVPLLNKAGNHFLNGNLLSFSAGPLTLADPLAVAQAFAGSFSGTAAMFLGGGLALLAALVLGPVFCSWICPYGLFSELLHSCRADRRAVKASVRGFAVKAAIVCAGLLLIAFYFHAPLLNQLSMPGWYTRVLQHAVLYREVLWGAGLLATALAVEVISGVRLWCRYVCPQSVLLSLAGMLLPYRLRIGFEPKSCTCGTQRACAGACTLGLDPRRDTAAVRLQCTNCGDCVDACRKRGRALGFSFGIPWKK